MRLIREGKAALWQLKREGFTFNATYAVSIIAFFAAFIASAILAKLTVISVMGVHVVSPFNGYHFFYAPFIFTALVLSITFYQHRMVAHRSAKFVLRENTNPWFAVMHKALFYGFHFVFTYLQTSAVQASLISWGGQHRVHHAMEDKQKDPYSVWKFKFSAFWSYMWAHWANFCFNSPYQESYDNAGKNIAREAPFAAFQHKFYVPLVVGVLLLNSYMVMLLTQDVYSFSGYFVSMLYMMGIVGAVHQVTWTVNSLTHSRTKSEKEKVHHNSAVDRPIAMLFSIPQAGEANQHQGHHKYAGDFFNGAVSRLVYDPTGWFGLWLSSLGVVELKQVSPKILYRYQLETKMECVLCQLPHKLKERAHATVEEFHERLDERLVAVQIAWKELGDAKRAYMEDRSKAMHIAYKEARVRLRKAYKEMNGDFREMMDEFSKKVPVPSA